MFMASLLTRTMASNFSAAQVAVAVLHRMDTRKHADKAAAAKHFARTLHDQWGVGNPSCQNGALLLLAIGDRQASSSCRGRGSSISTGLGDCMIASSHDVLCSTASYSRGVVVFQGPLY